MPLAYELAAGGPDTDNPVGIDSIGIVKNGRLLIQELEHPFRCGQSLLSLNIQIGNDNSFPLTNGMPMGAQFELSALIFLEGVIADIVHTKGLTEEGMRAIHANLE